MDPTLRLKPAQLCLTPEQGVEAERFAEDAVRIQLSTEPADEQAAEQFLQQIYAQVNLAPPFHIHWVDGPLQLVSMLTTQQVGIGVWDNAWDAIWRKSGDKVLAETGRSLWDSVWTSVGGTIRANVGGLVGDNSTDGCVGTVIGASVLASMNASIEACIRENEDRIKDSLFPGIGSDITTISTGDLMRDVAASSVAAYQNAHWLACYAFFDRHFAPNDFHARNSFNELVSGYWLGKESAVIVRRPHLLIRDTQGRLHSETGRCIEYHDGWGFSARHGVPVPARVILEPESQA